MGHWLDGAGAVGAWRKFVQSWVSDIWGESASWLVVVSLKGHNEVSLGNVEKNCSLQPNIATETKC